MKKIGDGKKLILKNIGVEKMIVLLIVGLLLLMLSKPFFDEEKEPSVNNSNQLLLNNNETSPENEYVEKLEEKLEASLSQIEGVGKVKVLITLKASKELVVNKDQPYSTSRTEERDSEGGERLTTESTYEEETILTNNGTGSNEPFVIKELEPEINGVIILAEGGDQATIKSELTNAAKVLFDIPAHRIKVMKMVSN